VTLTYIKLIYAILFSYISLAGIQAQIVEEKIYKNDIKTVQLYKTGWELSYPVIRLNSDEQLTLSFDELSNESHQYYYSLVLLTADDEESNLSAMEYVTGFPHNAIDDYQFSMNTTYGYVHYQVNFPNDDIQILKSGNYAVKVYENYDSTKPVLIKHFKVFEPVVNIAANIRFPYNIAQRETHQQLNFTILHPNFRIDNPMQELKIEVIQNGRQDNIVKGLKPEFIKNSELTYEYQPTLVFEGGNEFRWLDMRSNRFLSEQVKQLVFSNPYYHAELYPDELKWQIPYTKKGDSNGQYVISLRDNKNPMLEGDYFFAHFSLPMETPMMKGNIYVMGALTNWQYTPLNKMTYNIDSKAYELTLLLKQGFYNYQYIYVDNATGKCNLTYLEGNHSITENNYSIFVYYRGPADTHDRLIGYTQANSLKNLTTN
jgi:hypothetical protein